MLEDSRDRIAAFEAAVAQLPECTLIVWRNAPDMIRDIGEQLPGTALISLDHDLVPDPGDPDPGDGLEVAEALAQHDAICPVILHTTNRDRAFSMLRELEDGGWEIQRVAPVGMGEDWIVKYWLPAVQELLQP